MWTKGGCTERMSLFAEYIETIVVSRAAYRCEQRYRRQPGEQSVCSIERTKEVSRPIISILYLNLRDIQEPADQQGTRVHTVVQSRWAACPIDQ
jgi:hypothetical protein